MLPIVSKILFADRRIFMRYYVTSDTHGYFTEFKNALENAGFFEDKEEHKLIVCGDLFDRGREALELQDFIVDLLDKDKAVLIRGNHEDLMLELIADYHNSSCFQPIHVSNGTTGTVMQLIQATLDDLDYESEECYKRLLETPFIKKIIPAMKDYFETEHYIFVHGWIPCLKVKNADGAEYLPVHDWRNTNPQYWNESRWINGMEAVRCGIIEKGKTIVCGHWHCSFGHSRYKNDGGEFDNCPNFNPYEAEGIIALDACTAFSGQVNVIVIED